MKAFSPPILCALLMLFFAAPSWAIETIITNPKRSALDKRFDHPVELLKLALARTEGGNGEVHVRSYHTPLPRRRALSELVKGNITVFAAPTRPEWEDAAIPVRIPLRKGLMGYRLFLIRAEDQPAFKTVKSITDLKFFRVGQGLQWSTAAVLRQQGFDVHGSNEYEALFKMLMSERFDYFPRGINEIFTEFDLRKDTFYDMRIENSLALYLPLPYYFFVSPTRPDLAKRLETGLKKMMDDGSFDETFLRHYGDSIKRAQLSDRLILRLDNPNLPTETPLDQSELWFSPSD